MGKRRWVLWSEEERRGVVRSCWRRESQDHYSENDYEENYSENDYQENYTETKREWRRFRFTDVIAIIAQFVTHYFPEWTNWSSSGNKNPSSWNPPDKSDFDKINIDKINSDFDKINQANINNAMQNTPNRYPRPGKWKRLLFEISYFSI